MGLRGKKKDESDKILDVQAHMQGSLVFDEPVALRISGGFTGTLKTRGELTIGEKAQVKAEITGDVIIVAGRVNGKIIANRSLKLVAPAQVTGEVLTPSLEVERGARIDGQIQMGTSSAQMSIQEVSEYLEVERQLVEQWAQEGKIPGVQKGAEWRFEKNKIDEWVTTQKSS